MDNCIFCKIISRQIPADVVYEDEELLAFKDIHPAAPVHFLIIPKLHLATLADAQPAHAALLGRMLEMAPRLAQEQGCGVHNNSDGGLSGGYKTLINTGPDGGQEVYHLHMHVIGGAKPWQGQR
ncbi:MAG: histidine triad nucleotide-binding protein [Undibacterium sp.]|nr:histidine triad nucleotide-binding protein [Undibacterium sp.]MDO9192046.1 histidine triad nucleotide-binding protein [Undibacterium sp.]